MPSSQSILAFRSALPEPDAAATGGVMHSVVAAEIEPSPGFGRLRPVAGLKGRP